MKEATNTTAQPLNELVKNRAALRDHLTQSTVSPEVRLNRLRQVVRVAQEEKQVTQRRTLFEATKQALQFEKARAGIQPEELEALKTLEAEADKAENLPPVQESKILQALHERKQEFKEASWGQILSVGGAAIVGGALLATLYDKLIGSKQKPGLLRKTGRFFSAVFGAIGGVWLLRHLGFGGGGGGMGGSAQIERKETDTTDASKKPTGPDKTTNINIIWPGRAGIVVLDDTVHIHVYTPGSSLELEGKKYTQEELRQKFLELKKQYPEKKLSVVCERVEPTANNVSAAPYDTEPTRMDAIYQLEQAGKGIVEYQGPKTR